MNFAASKYRIIGFVTLAMMTAIVPSAFAATADERAECEKMAKSMGTEQRHEHSQDKGQGPGAMNTMHARCMEILAEPSPGKKKEDHGSMHESK